MKEQFHPLGCDAADVRIDDGTGFDFEPSSDLENRAKRAPFAGDSVIGRDNPVECALPIADKEGFQIDHGMGDDGGGVVGGATVGIHQDGTMAVKVFCQSGSDGANDMSDGPRIIEAGNTDQNVGAADCSQQLFGFRSEWDQAGAHETGCRVSAAGSQAWSCSTASMSR